MKAGLIALGCAMMLLAAACMGAAGPAAPTVIPFPNGSFDEGEAHWFFSRERGVQSRATAEFCYSKPAAMRIYADKDKGVSARFLTQHANAPVDVVAWATRSVDGKVGRSAPLHVPD